MIIISIIVIIVWKLLGARNTSISSNDSTPVLNAYFKCNGTERNLKNCPVRQWSDCYMNLSVAGLTCGGTF